MRWLRGFEDVPNKAVVMTVVVSFLSPIVHWLSLGPAIPQITFVQISLLPDYQAITDPSDLVYYFLRPPVYEPLEWIYTLPAAFISVGWICHGILNLLVFALVFRGLKRVPLPAAPVTPWMTALVVSVSAYPVGLVLGVTGHGTTLIPHDVYYTFSFRTFFWILATIAYILVLERRWVAGLMAMALSCYVHPSAGVVGFGLLTLLVGHDLLRKWNRRLLLWWACAAFIGALPNLFKILFVELPLELTEDMAFGEWYSQLIKDEADDFSALFQLANRGIGVGIIFAALVTLLGLYAWKIPTFRTHRSFWCALSVPVLFLLVALFEYVGGVLYPSFVIYPISALTLGYRLLSYAFLPVLVIGARLVAILFNRGVSWISDPRSSAGDRASLIGTTVLVVAVWLGFLGVGFHRGAVPASIAYARWAWNAETVPGIDGYFVGAQQAGANRYHQPPVFEGAERFTTYPGERSVFAINHYNETQPKRIEASSYDRMRSLDAFLELIREVRSKIPEGQGLYIPQHQRHFRDALPRHPIFLQEHPDGNVMMISPSVTRFWLARMQDLLGITYEQMPNKDSGLMYTVLRNAYLKVNDSKCRSLLEKYPTYRYFVTEEGHRLAFESVILTGEYVVYDLSKPL